MLSDGNHTYTWDADGNSVSLDTVGLTFDAFDRMVEQNRSSTYTEIVYSAGGAKLALMSGTGGQTLQKAFVSLPGQAAAVYTSTGLDHYRHSDWLGSARLTSSTTRTVLSTTAYAPFGETYAQSGTADISFTGQSPDTVSGDYDFLFREYSTEGRWPSPDPAGISAVDPTTPQSWNRYAYVLNNPLDSVDFFGLCGETTSVGSTVNGVPTGPPADTSYPCSFTSYPMPNFLPRMPCAGIFYMQCGPLPPPPAPISPSPTWAAIKTFFTAPSTGPGSCIQVALDAAKGPLDKAGRLAQNAQKYAAPVARALSSGSAYIAVNLNDLLRARQLDPLLGPAIAAGATTVAAVASEVSAGVATAAPYVGYSLAIAAEGIALVGVIKEGHAAATGKCHP